MSKKRRCLITILLIFICLAAGCAWAVFRSCHNPVVRQYEVKNESIKNEVTVAVISDLHDHEFGPGNRQLTQHIAALDPDLILAVGDFVSAGSEEPEITVSLIKDLAVIAPVYFTPGNHELEYMENGGDPALLQKISDAGAVVLDKTYRDITVCGQVIRIGGLYDYAFALDGFDSTNPENMEPETYAFLCDFQKTDSFKLMLSHRPDSFVLGEASKTWDVDLAVSGHTHGGQVVLPFLGGLWASEQGFFPEYVHGLYAKDKIQIFITSGLGSDSQIVPRFNNPPEIALLHLLPAER